MDRPTPTTYEEAALDQNPDIDRQFDKLCAKLASCDIKPGNKIGEILGDKLDEAHLDQLKKGHKATWRKVRFKEHGDDQKQRSSEKKRLADGRSTSEKSKKSRGGTSL